MRKLYLVGISSERDKILNALERTGAVEVKRHGELEGTHELSEDGEALQAYSQSVEEALGILSAHAERREGDVVVSASDFFAAGARRAQMDTFVSKIFALRDEKNAAEADRSKLERELLSAAPYAKLPLPFDRYCDTPHARVRLGLVPKATLLQLKAELQAIPLCAFSCEEDGEWALFAAEAHKSVSPQVEEALARSGFSPCPFSGEETGQNVLLSLQEKKAQAEERIRCAEEELLELAKSMEDLKIYCDFVGFELEKRELSQKLRGTERTFFLEAFVPQEREELVGQALLKTTDALFYEFADPAEDEPLPTLMKNNKVVENFETITNMYSVPDAREMDPNTVMAFFYSLFLGFIMADVGYGLMMLLGGGFLYYKNRAQKGGIKSLAGVFAVGGVFAIIWGILFNSFLGISALPFTVMPNAQTKMWSLMGIEIPAILIVSLLIGLVQILAGYLCKAAQYWRKGKFFDGLFEGFVWAVFSLGALVAVVGLLTVENDGGEVVFHEPLLAKVGGIIAAACLAVAVLTAGRHEKFLGKLSKGFGALYGLINYFTDVLSYIRLYGLMLTGAVIAQVISQYSVQFLTSGSFLIVLGALLMVIGHVFNLAIGLLGAYIHDARLQYVEFFGRFYTGEGRLFTPLGSNKKYVSVVG